MGETAAAGGGSGLVDKKKQFPGAPTAESQQAERESQQATSQAADKLTAATGGGSGETGAGGGSRSEGSRGGGGLPQIDSRAAVREQRAAEEADEGQDTSPEATAGRRRRRLQAARPRRNIARIKPRSEAGTNVAEPGVTSGVAIPR